MINKELLKPESIAIIGASNHISKPGGKIVKNLIDNNYQGRIYPVNPNDELVQGLISYKNIESLPHAEMAILAIPSNYCLDAVRVLAEEKNTKAFIIISAGFGETDEKGKQLEKEIAAIVTKNRGCLIGPNCIGIMTPWHASVFTTPIPKLTPEGCDLISGSGATAVFIIESGIQKGLTFSNVFSVGNSAQTGIEDILAWMDETYKAGVSPKVKLLYIENINNPDKLLYHTSSLIEKGCRIAAIKAGSSQAGSRAASSHTGAMISSDAAVEALFRKAGIVRCYGREELTTVAGIFMCNELKGKKIGIITHAGGPGVMLADALETGGLKIPQIEDSESKTKLKNCLFAGSSVENPIDFLATGTAEHLEKIIDACENDFVLDGMAVIFGSPGLFPITDVFDVLNQKKQECKKPIYPILPSLVNIKEDIARFLSLGNVNFPDEVLLGKALTKVMNTPKPQKNEIFLEGINVYQIKKIIANAENGYQPPHVLHALLDSAGIPRVKEVVAQTEQEAVLAAMKIGFPLVMKVIGPIHKTEVGGVILNVRNTTDVRKEFHHLMGIKDTEAVLIGQMAKGKELFLGAKYENGFGHILLCGMGGIYVEVLKDLASGLAPLSHPEAVSMIKSLKSYPILKGFRKQSGVNIERFADIIVRLSTLLRFATEIKELDINPLLGDEKEILAVDARVRIEK